MFCRKCGKEIDYQAEICHECAATQVSEFTVIPDVNTNIMLGFGKALTSAILGYVFIFITAISLSLAGIAIDDSRTTVPAFMMFVISTGLTVLTYVLSIGSIKLFKRVSQEGGKRPIPALIAGIHGLIFSIINSLFLFINLMMLFSI